MKRILTLILAMLLVLSGCGGTTMENTYQQITQEEAKDMMDTQEVIVLDVREQDEFDTGHIPEAVLLPVGTHYQGRSSRCDRRSGYGGSGILPQRKPQ